MNVLAGMAREEDRLLSGPSRTRKYSAAGYVIFIIVISGWFSSILSEACTSYPGYMAIFNATHSGDTIINVSSADAALKECNIRDDCRGFTSSGELKLKTFPITADNGDNSTCLYTKVDVLCPDIKGYWVATDSDVQGNTVASYPNASEAAHACNNDPCCAGFNSRGFTKNRSMPLITCRRSCFYTKLSTVCPSLQNTRIAAKYYTLPDLNSNGAVRISASTLDKSIASCSTDAACRGVSSLKECKGAGVLQSSRGICFYAKRQADGASCGIVPRGYRVAIDYDTTGGSVLAALNGSTVDAAAAACDADTACRGFSRRDGISSFLKSTTSPLVLTPKACFFIKFETAGCPAYAGYKAEPNANHEGDTISVENSSMDAYTACEKDETCEGFNSKGALQRLARPLSISRGTCFYQKIKVGCVQQHGYYTIPDATVQGSDNDITTFALNTLSDTPLSEARNACNMDPNCKGYTSAISAKKAVTKKATFPLVYSRKECVYSKAPTGCDKFDGYDDVSDMDVIDANNNASLINVYANVTDAVGACNADPTCLSVNSLGQTKKSTSSSYYHGVCLYVKSLGPPTPAPTSPPLPTGVSIPAYPWHPPPINVPPPSLPTGIFPENDPPQPPPTNFPSSTRTGGISAESESPPPLKAAKAGNLDVRLISYTDVEDYDYGVNKNLTGPN